MEGSSYNSTQTEVRESNNFNPFRYLEAEAVYFYLREKREFRSSFMLVDLNVSNSLVGSLYINRCYSLGT